MDKKITDVRTTKNCTIKTIYYSDKKRRTEEIQFDWYFYISAEDYDKNKERLNDRYTFEGLLLRYEKEGNWVKVFSDYRKKTRAVIVKKFKKLNIQTYETDLSLSRRFWLDNDYHLAEPEYFRILFFDIEVDPYGSRIKVFYIKKGKENTTLEDVLRVYQVKKSIRNR